MSKEAARLLSREAAKRLVPFNSLWFQQVHCRCTAFLGTRKKQAGGRVARERKAQSFFQVLYYCKVFPAQVRPCTCSIGFPIILYHLFVHLSLPSVSVTAPQLVLCDPVCMHHGPVSMQEAETLFTVTAILCIHQSP